MANFMFVSCEVLHVAFQLDAGINFKLSIYLLFLHDICKLFSSWRENFQYIVIVRIVILL